MLLEIQKEKHERKKMRIRFRQVIGVATTQEEIGTRGAITAAFSENPDFAIAVDVGHATDSPNCDNRKYGKFIQGGGPIICKGPNINPIVFKKLKALAEEKEFHIKSKQMLAPLVPMQG